MPPMSETVGLVKTFSVGIQLVWSHENLVRKPVALLAHGIVDTVPGLAFLIKIANLSLSCTTLSKSMKVAMRTAAPKSWLGDRSTADQFGTAFSVQICKASQLREEKLDRYYDTKRQKANRQNED